jgi:hypothetical protein
VKVLEEIARLRALAVAVAIMAVVWVFVVTLVPVRPDGTVDNRVGLVGWFLLAILLVGWFGLFLAHKFCFYRRIEMYESRDTSGTRTEPPKAIAVQAQILIGLGFQLLGEYEYRWPWQRWEKTWVFSRSDLGIDVQLGNRLGLCFSSRWADHSELTTVRGMPRQVFDLEGARIVVLPASLPALLEAHSRQAAELSEIRGAPAAVGSVAEALANQASDLALAKRLMTASWTSPVTWALLALMLGLMLAPALIVTLLV